MSGMKSVNSLTKILLIILVIIISYLLLSSVLTEGFAQQPTSIGEISGMMDHMRDNGDMDDMMDQMRDNDQNTHINTSQNYILVSLTALSVALMAGVLVSVWLKKEKARTPIVKTEAPLVKTDELDIIKRALSDDETAVLNEVRRAGEITQGSLRFRLEWSKAKLSRILTNFDKMNIIQRERVGKTYNVFLTGKRPKQ